MKDENKVFYLLMITSFTLSVGLSAVIPIQPLFMVEVGATELELGLIFAFSSLLGLFSRIPLGILSDKIGRWIMIIITSVINIVSLIAYFLVNSVVWFYPITVLDAMTWGFFAPSAISLVSDTVSPERMGSVMGLYYTSLGLGQFIGPLVCSGLTTYTTYRKTFFILTIFPIAGLLATLGWRSIDVSKKHDEVDFSKENLRVMDTFKRILRSRNVIGVGISRMLFSLSSSIIDTIFSVWANSELFFTSAMISILFSVRGATNTSIRIPIGRLVDKIGKKIPLLLAFCLAATGFLIFSVTNNFYIILIAMALYGLAWGIRIVPDTAILTESTDLKDRELAFAFMMTMFAMGRSIGSFVAGVTYTVLPMSIILQMAAGVLFSAVVVLSVAIKKED